MRFQDFAVPLRYKLKHYTTMTKQEFTKRTNVEVTDIEFNAINEVYNNSDLNKDEFCKLWRKMNKTRVAAAIEQQKVEEAKAKEEWWDLLNLSRYDFAKKYGFCY